MSYPLIGQTIIEMEKQGGVYKIPCVVNGLRLKFIFDTGASQVCISESQALMMLENDYLSTDDIKGTSTSMVADGRIVDNTKIILKEIVIGGKKLKDVEAVVVHSQNAPLLLGQSAIEKLGKVSLQGNKLIIEDYSDVRTFEMKHLTDQECERLLNEAINFYYEEAYEDALENYQILHANNYLSHKGIFKMAYCLCRLNEYTEALKYFFQIEGPYREYENGDDIGELYKFIALCYEDTNQFGKYERYMLKAISYCESPFLKFRYRYQLGYSYKINNNDYYLARSYLQETLNDYFEYMDIKYTDCWDKNYKDEFVAKVYYSMSCCSEGYKEDISDKYSIIAAKWGKKEAIEWCKEFKLNYLTKPTQYEY